MPTVLFKKGKMMKTDDFCANQLLERMQKETSITFIELWLLAFDFEHYEAAIRRLAIKKFGSFPCIYGRAPSIRRAIALSRQSRPANDPVQSLFMEFRALQAAA